VADQRRVVRVSRAFFDEIDRVLGPDRGPMGQPSANDFLTIDLLPIVDTFAARFDELLEAVPGRPDYRLLVSGGSLVPAISVIGQLALDGSIELISIRIDTGHQTEGGGIH
jgi:hypothetical protein